MKSGFNFNIGVLLLLCFGTFGTVNSIKSPSTMASTKKLNKLGYGFNDDGKLRQVDKKTGQLTEKPFEFQISSNHSRNQKNYEKLGDSITNYVYELLETHGLHKIYIPSTVPESKATFVFCTKRDLTNVKKLIVLINGSGVVRAGQWARSLIINHSLSHGTQVPYIELARELGYEVLILNTNDNERDGKPIPGHSTPTEHAISVWSELIADANVEGIAIVAHSYGGVVTMKLAEKYADQFGTSVFAVGLTDSVHRGYSAILQHMRKIGRNWVTSTRPLNSESECQDPHDVICLSAGHTKHEWTSWSAMDVLLEFFENQYKDFLYSKLKVDL